MSAYAPPPSGTPAWEPPSRASYHQPQTPFPSSQYGQYPAYPGPYPVYSSDQPEQYPDNPSSQYGQYLAYPSNQPGQHNAYQYEQTHFYPNPTNPSPYLNKPPATGVGTASATPVAHHPETRDPTRSRRATAPQPSSGEEPRRQGREPGQQQSRHADDGTWSRAEDKELVWLKGEYDTYRKKAWLTAQGMYRAGFNRTEEECEKRWNNVLKAINPNFEPKDWSKDEDNWLTELVKNFDKWDTLNGWEEISDQMRAAGSRRAPENCRGRWQETLRGPAKTGDWEEDEEKFLIDFHSQYSIVELVDLLERKFHSIRSVDQCARKRFRLRQGQVTLRRENAVDWSPAAD